MATGATVGLVLVGKSPVSAAPEGTAATDIPGVSGGAKPGMFKVGFSGAAVVAAGAAVATGATVAAGATVGVAGTPPAGAAVVARMPAT